MKSSNVEIADKLREAASVIGSMSYDSWHNSCSTRPHEEWWNSSYEKSVYLSLIKMADKIEKE